MSNEFEGERAAMAMPAAYLVPLRYNDQQARSYVFAFTRWLPPEEVHMHLPTVKRLRSIGNVIPRGRLTFPPIPDPVSIGGSELVTLAQKRSTAEKWRSR